MRGVLRAIFGDNVGSIYEASPIKITDFPLFAEGATITNDTICKLSIADGLLSGDFAGHLPTWVHCLRHTGKGGRFHTWVFADGSDALRSH
jgi:ADP-ribosyl-[dinitrogen reductase] hydrolase